MVSVDDIIVKSTSSITDVIRTIDSSSKQIALVVDENKRIIGTVCDGDIRSSILNNISLDNSIEDIFNRNPIVANMTHSKEDILNICIREKIHQVPIVDENNRLLGIEILDDLISKKKKNNKVVLMVGGLGTRLRPLTENMPKPMLKVGNKPILETIILNFKKHGFINIILSVSYKSEIIEEYFGDGSKFGVNIEFVHEDKRMGTAGALGLMKEKLNEPFFVMNGDLLTNINFEHMMEFHLSKNSVATMGVREYDFQVPYGVVNLEQENITSIEEKPIQRFFVSAGVYVLNQEVLDFIPQNDFFDMPKLFEKTIDAQMKTISFPIREYWIDIGRLEEFEKANKEYQSCFNV